MLVLVIENICMYVFIWVYMNLKLREVKFMGSRIKFLLHFFSSYSTPYFSVNDSFIHSIRSSVDFPSSWFSINLGFIFYYVYVSQYVCVFNILLKIYWNVDIIYFVLFFVIMKRQKNILICIKYKKIIKIYNKHKKYIRILWSRMCCHQFRKKEYHTIYDV